jgi:O-antigen/teichoic acid export membrane protein
MMFRFEAHPRFFALLKNAGVVFSGNALSSIIGVLYLGVLTRTITLEQFGLYSLYGAFVELISRLTSFQTWQGLIHYGSHAKESGDKPLLMNLLLFGWLLDILAGIAGFCIAVACAIWIPSLFGLSLDDYTPAVVAAAILLFNWTSSPAAFLRIYDRFVPQAIYQNVAAVFQLVSVCILWWLGETRLVVYLAATSINNIIGQLWFFGYSIHLAHRDGIIDSYKINLRALPSKCPGIWRYVTITNLDGVVRVARDMDIFIVNALIDVRAAGLYKIARTLSSAMGKVTGPFYLTIYPELARMVAARNVGSMVKLMKQSALTLGAITAVIWIGFGILGPVFLKLAFGADYVGAYPAAVWCMGAMVVWGLAQPLSPAMMAMRRPGQSLMVHLVTTSAYVATLYLTVPFYGLLGAGISMFLFYVLWSTIMLVVVTREIRSYSLDRRE